MHKEYPDQLSALISVGPIVVYTSEAFGAFAATSITPNITEQLGYEVDEFLNTPSLWASNIHPDDAPDIFKNLSMLFENMYHTHEYRFRHKDGSYRWMHDDLRLVLDDNGQPKTIVGYWTDITGYRDAENERAGVAAQEIRQLKTSLDLTQDRVHMFRPDTLKFFYGNQSALKHAGCSEEEFNNMTPLDVNPTLDEEEFRERISVLISGDQEAILYESVHPNALGELVPVEVLMQYLSPVGEKPRFVTVIRDVTERKVAEKVKSEFISTVSHELRTPLTSIKGALGLIKAGALDGNIDNLHSMVNIAYNNSERLVLLINDLLDMEKLEAGKMRLRMEPTDISALLEEAVVANKGYGEEYGVTFTYFGTDAPVFVNADKDRMIKVIANLLSNAAKFSPRGGVIEVSLTLRNGDIRIAVKDYGSGIPKEAQETIFEKFTQADSSDQRQRGGSGLGLSIVKMIVEEHDGHVGFTSTVGEGTTFYVDLPEVEAKTMQQTFEFGR